MIPFLAGTPALFKASIAMQGSGMVGMIVAQTAPNADVLQYGSTGVVSLSFMYMIYALSAGKIVSSLTETTQARLLELLSKSEAREEASQRREDTLIAMNQNLISVLTAKKPPHTGGVSNV